ncbi:hypothetical protein [Sulfurimonas sp.]|uniref:hypothetical protein n=1 Tax=Sulfurimonas sp. TaxID=2022749 RepID=UPI003D146D54
MLRKVLINFSMIVGASTFIIGCGGGGSSSSGDTNSVTVLSGVFVDSAVEGLEYSTPTRSGVTDENGTFYYLNGEEVEFSIGGIALGHVGASQRLTPLELAGVNNVHDARVEKTLVLLQSLDEDGNSSNGIVIPAGIRTLANTMSEDLSGAFDANATLIGLGVDSEDIVGADSAKDHFRDTLNEYVHNSIAQGEFNILEGVYQSDDTIMQINENGMITMYTYNTDDYCIDQISEDDNGYGMDSLFVTHDQDAQKFSVDVNGNTYGWNYSNGLLTSVYNGGISAQTLNLSVAEVSIFLTTQKSTEFSEDNISANMCSILGTSNRFKHLKGVYQNESYTDSNATLQEEIRATVTYIDENATIHAYKVDTNNSCLLEVTANDYNYDINAKVLDTREFEYTIDNDANLKQYYAVDSSGNRFSWLQTEDNSISYIGYKIADNVPNVSETTLNVTDLKISLTTQKSTTYNQNNITTSLCN